MAGAEIQSLTRNLESAFRRIRRERMADVPILNPRISIRAVDFRCWGAGFLGVMITPWFMNLMLLPGKNEDWEDLEELGKVDHAFPSGVYEFIVGHEDGIGKYQMCSLFSPMFEFADDLAAVDTARSVLTELMNRENVDDSGSHEQATLGHWHGDADGAVEERNEAQPEQVAAAPLQQRLEQPLSRRQLLRAALLQEGSTR